MRGRASNTWTCPDRRLIVLSGKAKIGNWQAAAMSNDKGLFFVPMPIGLTGKVNVSVTSEGAKSETTVLYP